MAKQKTKAIAKKESSIASAIDNENLLKMYKDSAELGSENLSQTLPLLKVHASGRSSSNQLADGDEPKDGYFFYKPTKEQFKDVTAHILTISRGFRAEGLEGQSDVFNQILAGVIMDESDFKPFLMYFTGTKLQNLWDFGKEASPYTKARPVPIPLFALTVKMTTEQVKTKFGKAWVVKFEIIKNDKGIPQVITDEGLFTFLRDSVKSVEDTINNVIATRTGEEVYETPEKKGVATSVSQVKEAVGDEDEEDIESKDVPF